MKFRGMNVSNAHEPEKIRQWVNNGSRIVDDIFGPYYSYRRDIARLKRQEAYLVNLRVPFITTMWGKPLQYKIWKEQKAPHIR